MNKRRKKGKKKGAYSHNESDIRSDLDESLQNSNSSSEKVPELLKVILDDKHNYSTWIKVRNAIFLHPSVIRVHGAPRYFLIRGSENCSLCVAYSLKSIKNTTVLFPKDTLDFQQGELVTVEPYNDNILNASEVTVHFGGEVTVDEDLKLQVLKSLGSKRFFYKGMKLKYDFNNSCEFIVTNMSYEEPGNSNSLEVCDVSSIETNFTSQYESFNISVKDQSCQKLISRGLDTKTDESFPHSCSQLDSMLSSLSLNDSQIQDSRDDVLKHKFGVPTFFSAYHGTTIVIHTDVEEMEDITYLPSFERVGGLRKQLQTVKLHIDVFLNSQRNHHTPIVGTLLLLGPPGTGKTLVLDAIRNEYHCHIQEINWCSLYSKTASEAEQELQHVFQNAKNRFPCIILVDDYNYLCPKRKDAQSIKIINILSNCIRTSTENEILVIAAANNSDYDGAVLNIEGRNLEEIPFHTPVDQEREEILLKLLESRRLSLSPNEIELCVMYSQGFTGRDLSDVLNDAVTYRCFRKNKNGQIENFDGEIEFEDLRLALQHKKPSIIESQMKIKKVHWNDIGGMKMVKQKLTDIVDGPLKYREVYKRYDVRPPRGILLYGPPGCSKTMIAKALATECNLNFISKNVSDIHNKYVGESEKAVRDLFVLARAKSPCIIFLDEIDALAPGRGSSSGSGVEERIVNTFLQEMDGIEELNEVLVVAATNRPDRLDDAFVRNGRINHFIYIPLPDLETREEILKLQMRNRTVADDFDYKHIALRTEGYSGAEIVNICNEAAFQLLAEDIESTSAVFTLRHFEVALKCVLPRITKEMFAFYESYNENFLTK